MSIFKEAKERELNGYGYNSIKFKMIWKNKNIDWNWLGLAYGIRNSKKWQLFPIWNTSNNCQRSLKLGFWKLYIELIWHRKQIFNQDRRFFLRERLWKFYQLIS